MRSEFSKNQKLIKKFFKWQNMVSFTV